MHRRCDFFRSCARWALILACVGFDAHAAQVVPSLYGAVVSDSDAQQAAQDAMRQVLVRLTGERDAAGDPALAALITGARRYVQLQRSTTAGATRVLFDASTLGDALSAAGRRVWGPDRPLVWVLLPQQEGAGADALRARLVTAAQARGLPIVIATTDATAAAAPLAAARRAGAAAALIAQPVPADPASQQWTLVASSIDTRWTCRISGVADLPSFASVLTAVRTAREVSEVTVRAVDADSLLLQLKARGNEAELERALANDRLHVIASNAHGELDYKYQAAP
jgi:Uncharacterized protein conserved in bacteria (DUF2066)